ncbi:MAG: family transcriptional regulator, nitrogen fixation regulation protein [Alphaproteobacteria bacterium]|jgi:CRP/FNR family nitrogen fixation transcriptional regulator|nr:family transcriptional regulator, nitrogen fixation regulation protein [Alphaproteobacteria bacterium]
MKAITHSSPTNGAYYRSLFANRPHRLKSVDSIAAIMICHRGQEICREAQAAEHWYFVISGVVRRCVLRADGRRQIVGLLLPGDFFGFTAGDEYDYTAEAVADGTVLASYPRRRVEALADSDPSLARELRQVTFEAMSRLQAQLLILGRITALEKVGSFILEMETRLSHGRGDSIALPVSRYDIADYLAVSVETVSRSLTDLKQRGVIKLSGTRTVKIVDRDMLEEGEHEDCSGRLRPVARAA